MADETIKRLVKSAILQTTKHPGEKIPLKFGYNVRLRTDLKYRLYELCKDGDDFPVLSWRYSKIAVTGICYFLASIHEKASADQTVKVGFVTQTDSKRSKIKIHEYALFPMSDVAQFNIEIGKKANAYLDLHATDNIVHTNQTPGEGMVLSRGAVLKLLGYKGVITKSMIHLPRKKK